ncbi:MAG: UvrD-helicase domain-containing protein [Treponema sp.]|jgi:uncharacterized protein (TIGR00375 family)|nr:UvrD-helicase domain-containing protein [Treponema sp.]
MMRIIADLHIHSRFSRATSPRLTLPHLDRWARIKGINLVGSGDCTHPAWLSELREQLDEHGTTEEGFFTLKEDIRRTFDAGEAFVMGLPKPPNHLTSPRFVLTGEISTIYKSGDKTRKVHHLVILPDFKAAIRFQTLLERHGKITSDGRPILGIGSRELFSLLLEADERALLIPAHIWTPWFSAMGAKSGFDSIDECYGDLAPRIFAVETGLSSNPPMNWAVSALNRFSIISNSDAHSPEKLGRECTIFNMDMSLSALSAALHVDSDRARIDATIEFFPQEGKYHYDGHRKCGVCLTPEEALAQAGVCPVCHKPLTRGVMGRVMELATGVVDETLPCPLEKTEKSNRRPYYSLIPLKELLGELLETGVSSKKVDAAYHILIEKAGPELPLLMETPLDDIERLHYPELAGETLAAALKRMRTGQVSIQPGYDGEYGVIRAFPPKSARHTAHQYAIPQQYAVPLQNHDPNVVEIQHTVSLSPEQQAAVLYEGNHALIIAGPGSGKTATLAACIARLAQGGKAGGIVALSFTVKAALELRERIASIVADTAAITTATFHSFCASILREQTSAAGVSAEFRILNDTERDAILRELCDRETGRTRAEGLGKYIEARKRFLLLPGENEPPHVAPSLRLLVGELGLPPMKADEERLYTAYRERLRASDTMDFDDIVIETVRLLAMNSDMLVQYQQRFRAVFVDEYQDINFAQYVLIQFLAPKDDERLLRVIGDPNQAIYGFRGSDKRFIDRFLTDYPDARCFSLSESFRCAAPVIDAALSLVPESATLRGAQRTVQLYRAEYPTEKSEAEGIARRVSRLIGGTTFFAFDSGVADDAAAISSLDECAILLRTLSLASPIIKALGDHGIPFELSGETPWWEKEPINALLTFLREHKQSAPVLPPDKVIHTVWEQLVKSKAVKIPRGSRESAEAGVNRLSSMARSFDTLPAFLDILTLSDAATGEGMTHSGVAIMSIHASKGLEFDHVFVAGLEEGFLPFTLYETEHIPLERLDEEKRLLYVAMTRARHGLYLSCAQKRLFQGRTLSAGKSRFFYHLETLVPTENALPVRKRDQQLSLF